MTRFLIVILLAGALALPLFAHGAGDIGVVTLPLVGTIDPLGYSLPVLTVLIGALDGFNPCAMWTLVFLIGLLLDVPDRRRRWFLGGAFLGASALVYFLFMAAWLNLILLLGFVWWVRLVIALVALGGGVYGIRDYFVNTEAACEVGDVESKQRTMGRMRAAVMERSLWLSLVAIVALAFAVNLVELVCSAGLPAVYTQVLTLSALPAWQYYGYLLLYIFFFIVDDIAVFVVAMMTLELTGITTKYVRASRLVGGIIMILLGILLIVRPEWLAFG